LQGWISLIAVGWSFLFSGDSLDRLKILLDSDYVKALTILKTVWQ
jgi:hypothetical protein